MATRARLLLLVLPLLLVAGEAAQWVLGRLAPAGYLGAELLSGTHGRLAAGAMVAAAVGLAAFAVRAQVAAGADRRRLPVGACAALPIVLFALQEQLEYSLGSDHSAGTVVATRPAFLLGLALQLPFAFAAFAAARLLLGLAAAIGELRAGSRAGSLAGPTPAPRRLVDRGARRARLVPSARATRAPPPAPAC